MPAKNIVLIGTKLDLVDKRKKKRMVSHGEGVELGQRMNLAGFMEVSSINSPKAEIADCFMICAIHCIDETQNNPFYIGGAVGVKPAV